MAAKIHPALAAIRKCGADEVKAACSGIDGILRGKYLHKSKFEGAADGGRFQAALRKNLVADERRHSHE